MAKLQLQDNRAKSKTLKYVEIEELQPFTFEDCVDKFVYIKPRISNGLHHGGIKGKELLFNLITGVLHDHLLGKNGNGLLNKTVILANATINIE